MQKDETNKVLAGVCSGIANEFSIDPIIVRLGWCAFTLLTGFAVGIITYVIVALVMK